MMYTNDKHITLIKNRISCYRTYFCYFRKDYITRQTCDIHKEHHNNTSNTSNYMII